MANSEPVSIELSIVIPTHQRPALLRDLLNSIGSQSLAPERFEVLSVLNLPDNALQHELCAREWPKIHRVLCAGKLGVNRARNLGLSHALGKIALFLDDDCYLQNKTYLEQILERHRQWPEISAIGGPYLRENTSASLWEDSFQEIADRWLRGSVYNSAGDTINLIGGNVSYKVDHLKNLKLCFDENIIYGGAETSLHARLHLAGLKLRFDENLGVLHRPDLQPHQFVRKAFRQGFGFELRARRGLLVSYPGRRSATEIQASHRWSEKAAFKLYRLSFDWGRRWARWKAENQEIGL